MGEIEINVFKLYGNNNQRGRKILQLQKKIHIQKRKLGMYRYVTSNLKKQKDMYLDEIDSCRKEIIELNDKIFKMQCCENCIKTKTATCDDSLRVRAKVNRYCESWECGV